MAFNENSKMKDVLKDERAVAILEEFVPGASTHPQLPVIKNFSLKKIAKIPQAGVSPEAFEKLVEALKALD